MPKPFQPMSQKLMLVATVSAGLSTVPALATVISPSLVFPPPNATYVTPAGTAVSYPGSGTPLTITSLSFDPATTGTPLSPSQTTTVNTWPASGAVDFASQGVVQHARTSFASSFDFGPDTTPTATPLVFKFKLVAVKTISWAVAGEQERVSPTIPSTGEFDYAVQPDGTYQINSFFDIFTEISADGITWTPASGPLHMDLVGVPEPATVGLLTLAGLPLLRRRRRNCRG